MAPEPASDAPPYRILVLDDEPDTVDMVLRAVRGRYDAVGTTRASEALAWLESERFDAVLVDQRLRDGTGTAVLARCAAVSPLSPRVAMSGQAEVGDLLAAINIARVSHFLAKPFSAAELLQVLAEVLRSYQAQRDMLERRLLDRAEEAGERNLVPARRGGRRARQRPTHWPVGSGMREISAEDPRPLLDLFDPDLEMVLALLGPEWPFATETEAEAWHAELELRLVTRLRDTDQAFRRPDGRFVVVFGRTGLEGGRRACRRLAEELTGGLEIYMVRWGGGPADPSPFVKELLE